MRVRKVYKATVINYWIRVTKAGSPAYLPGSLPSTDPMMVMLKEYSEVVSKHPPRQTNFTKLPSRVSDVYDTAQTRLQKLYDEEGKEILRVCEEKKKLAGQPRRKRQLYFITAFAIAAKLDDLSSSRGV